jgi:hypothetical protein
MVTINVATEADLANSTSGEMIRVARRQMALTGGYMFTDYKVQGQTLECMVVVLAKPPT